MYPQPKKIPDEVVVYPKERYRGEFAGDAEVKAQQIHYYTWGTLFFQVTLILFFLTILFSMVSFILGVIGWYYISEQLRNIRFSY